VSATSEIIASNEVNWAIGSLAKHLPAWISYIKCEFLHFNGTNAKRRNQSSPAYPEQLATLTGLLPNSFVRLALMAAPSVVDFRAGGM
jgi:hypothetical protein